MLYHPVNKVLSLHAVPGRGTVRVRRDADSSSKFLKLSHATTVPPRIENAPASRERPGASQPEKGTVGMNQSKTCAKCTATQALSNFSRDRRAKDGYQRRCKACKKAEMNAYRLAQRDKLVEYSRAYYQSHRSDFLERRRKWLDENPHLRARQRYESRVSTETAKVSVFEISASAMRQIMRGACLYCGSRERLTLDHIVPVSRGGRHSVGNLAVACWSCNMSKGTKTIMEWRVWKMRRPPAA